MLFVGRPDLVGGVDMDIRRAWIRGVLLAALLFPGAPLWAQRLTTEAQQVVLVRS